MTNDKTLSIIVKAKDLASKKFKRIRDRVGSMGRKMVAFGKKAAIGFAAAGVAVGAFSAKAISAFNKQERALTQLDTLMKNVKGSIEGDTEALVKQASALQKVGVVGDEVTMMGQAQLATFQLQRKAIEKITPALLDMAVQINGVNVNQDQMQQLANLAGKAMLGQVGALTRYGVSLSDAQAEAIKNGDQMERAAVLAKVLEENFGGVNESMRKTFQGQMTAAKNTLGDFMELVGKLVSDRIKPMIAWFNRWSDSVGGADGMLELLKKKIDEVKQTVTPWIDNIRKAGKAVGDYLLPKLKTLWNTVKEDLIPALKNLWKNVIAPMIPVIGVALVVAFGLAIDIMNAAIKVIAPLIDWLGRNEYVLWGLIGAFGAWKVSMMITATINAVTSAITLMGSGMVASTVRTLGLRGALMSLAAAGGPFTLVAMAAAAAAAIIIKKWIETKKTIDKTKEAINSAGRSAQANEKKLISLIKTGNKAQKIRAYDTAHKLGHGQAANEALLGPGRTFATGTNYAPGGMARVGEFGPEEVYLPRGSKVVPNKQVKESSTINIYGSINLGSKDAVDRFFERLDSQKEMGALGVGL